MDNDDIESKLSGISSNLRVERLERELEKLSKTLEEQRERAWGRHVPVAVVTAVIGLFGTLLVTRMQGLAKDHELALAQISKERELQVRQSELQLELKKHQFAIQQKYLEYTMAPSGPDDDAFDRLLTFLEAVEADQSLKAWAAVQQDKLRQRADDDKHTLQRQLAVAEGQAQLDGSALAKLGKSRDVLAKEVEGLRSRVLRAESAWQRAAGSSQRGPEPACKPSTVRDEFGREPDACVRPSQTAVRDAGKWRWVAQSPAGKSVSCLCESES